MRVSLLALLLFGCSPPVCSPYYNHRFLDQFPPPYAYDVHPDADTGSGVRVDTSGLDVDLREIDRQIDDVEVCLTTSFGPTPYISPEVHVSLECDSDTFPLPIRRGDLTIKIAADYTWSCDGTMQLLPAPPADDSGCLTKGLTPSPDCPCRWRAGIQANRYVVVTPNLYLLRDPIVRMVTGCNQIWNEPTADCAVPK